MTVVPKRSEMNPCSPTPAAATLFFLVRAGRIHVWLSLYLLWKSLNPFENPPVNNAPARRSLNKCRVINKTDDDGGGETSVGESASPSERGYVRRAILYCGLMAAYCLFLSCASWKVVREFEFPAIPSTEVFFFNYEFYAFYSVCNV